jgi:hypothetical protein
LAWHFSPASGSPVLIVVLTSPSPSPPGVITSMVLGFLARGPSVAGGWGGCTLLLLYIGRRRLLLGGHGMGLRIGAATVKEPRPACAEPLTAGSAPPVLRYRVNARKDTHSSASICGCLCPFAPCSASWEPNRSASMPLRSQMDELPVFRESPSPSRCHLREGGVAHPTSEGGRAPFLGHCFDGGGAEKTT